MLQTSDDQPVTSQHNAFPCILLLIVGAWGGLRTYVHTYTHVLEVGIGR